MPSVLPVQAHRASRTCLPTPAAQAAVSTDKQGCRRQACVLRRLGGPLALIIGSILTPAFAISPGDLDTSFNAVGVALTPIGTSSNGYDVVVQPDGKILVAGSALVSNNRNFALARYNANGTLDTGFGINGVISASIGVGTDHCYAVALRPDGKIVCAGQRGDEQSIGLIRFNPNGSIDNSFGSFGRYSIAIASRKSYATDIAIQPDGKILVSAYADDFNNVTRVGLVRLLPDGGLDQGFADGGIASPSIGIGMAVSGMLALQPDGRIVIGGNYFSSINGYDFLLLRFLGDGSLDTSFDGDGIVITPFDSATSFDVVGQVAVQADGKIIAAGTTNTRGPNDVAIARYLSNGALDTTFDGDGRAIADGARDSRIDAVVVQPNGRIITGGSYRDGSPASELFLLRHNVDGSLDASFGIGGVRTLSVTGDDELRAMAIQTDGKLVTTGTAWNPGSNRFIVTRFHTEPPTDAIFAHGFEQP